MSDFSHRSTTRTVHCEECGTPFCEEEGKQCNCDREEEEEDGEE